MDEIIGNTNVNLKSIEGLEVYNCSLKISDWAWQIYLELPKTYRFHIGSQFLDAADSIGANIAEGYGRYHYKESINFNNYARGSAFETRHWLNRLFSRQLVKTEYSDELGNLLDLTIKKINGYNNYLRSKQLSGKWNDIIILPNNLISSIG